MNLDDELNPTNLTLPVCGRPIGLRMIAHQLNNTLVPVLTLGSLLADSLQEAETARDLDLMVVSAKRARALVKMLVAEIDRLEGVAAFRESGVVVPFATRMPA
jgi:hypothetical protein